MTASHFLTHLTIWVIIAYNCELIHAITRPDMEPSTTITSESSIEDIRTELSGMEIPLLDFTFKDNAIPSYDVIKSEFGAISITNNEYVEGKFTISIKGEIIYDSGDYKKKESGVRVKARGNTTTAAENNPKKSYKIKLSKKADLLLRNDKNYADKDWVILGSGSRNLNYVAGCETARACGMKWAPEGRHVAIIMNDKYLGSYYLAEAVNGSSCRADVETSGFLIENDAYWWKPNEIYFKSNHLPETVGWTFKEPDTDDFDEMSIANIQWAINTMEKALYNGKDISDMIDFESFARWLLSHDILNTYDQAGSNMFVIKRNFNSLSPFETKFEMGPLWDFDCIFGKSFERHANIFSYDSFYYPKLLEYPEFQDIFLQIWNDIKLTLKDRVLSYVEKYITDNPDIHKIRLIDDKFGLLKAIGMSCPYDDYERLVEWFDKRLPALDFLITGESGIDIVESRQPNANNITPSFTKYDLNGVMIQGAHKGISIHVSPDGNTFKTINK